MKIFRSIALVSSLVLILVGCGLASNNDEVTPTNPSEEVVVSEFKKTPVERPLVHFSADLFRTTAQREGNTLVSPYSVLNALAMTAGGADGDTLAEFETLFSMDINALHQELKELRENYGANQRDGMHIANNIWVNEDTNFKINDDFAQLALENYGAEIESIPFNDGSVKKINQWVDENTNHMIPEIIDKLTLEDTMVLINALSLELEWEEPYPEYQVNDGKFTTDQGREIDREFMSSEEFIYLQDENTTGFIKPYRDGDFAFVALLPHEGIDINNYVLSFTEQKMNGLLESQEQTVVSAQMPKFKVEDGLGLKSPLEAMGLERAWDEELADFSKMGETETGKLFMDRVIHKTFIQLDELGTKAGASTAVIMDEAAAFDQEVKVVKLNRPFVYMIIDQRIDLPIFMGKYVGE